MCVYAPTDDVSRRIFFTNLWPATRATEYFVIAGDFNCIRDLNLDKTGGNPSRGLIGNNELASFVSAIKTVDVWRATHPHTKQYTWANPDRSIQTRIDRIYVSQDLIPGTDSAIAFCPFTDHDAVTVNIAIPLANHRGPGTWKLDTTLLQDPGYEHEINAFLAYWRQQAAMDADPVTVWETLKHHVKRISIEHATRRARAQRQEKTTILRRLEHLQTVRDPDQPTIDQEREHLAAVIDREATGDIIRSRAQWHEKGEKASRYFFGLEKHRQKKHCITTLRTNDDTTISSNIEILTATKEYYQALYTREPTDAGTQEDFLVCLDCKLSDDDQTRCEGPITGEELCAALNTMAGNKAPGPDGLPKEFYVAFWPNLVPFLTSMGNENYARSTMSDSQREALLRLLFKKNDRDLLKNWRPISLLNVDYKLFEKVLALRLRRVLPGVIYPDQTCGIPGRSIHESISTLRDTIHQTNRGGQVILISLDQEKAFDRIDRSFLFKVLERMNFGESFINWIRTLYNNCFSRIINNGWLSDPVYLHRGLRQGCPLSPLLYCIATEPMAERLRREPMVKGVHIPGGDGRAAKLVQYADDMSLLLSTERSVTVAFDIIVAFRQASGSKLNMDKTEGMFFGPQFGRTTGPVPIKWKADNLNILGATISPTMEQQWNPQLEKLETKLGLWSSRRLSIRGRALIARTYGLATIIYLAACFSLPNAVATRINTLLFRFLWHNGVEYVKRSTLYKPEPQGGLNIPDVADTSVAMKVKWALKLPHLTNLGVWALWTRYHLGMSLASLNKGWAFLRRLNAPYRDPKHSPPWYKEVTTFIQKHRADLTALIESGTTPSTRSLRGMQQNQESSRAEGKWASTGTPPVILGQQWQTTWKGINTAAEKELRWRALHWSLPTRARISRWRGMNITSQCPFCPFQETMAHALFECGRLRPLWDLVNTWLRQMALPPVWQFHSVLFFPPAQPTTPPEADLLRQYLISCAAHIAWRTRVEKSLHNQDPADLTLLLRSRIQERIQWDQFNHRPTIDTVWAYKEILITVENTRVHYNI